MSQATFLCQVQHKVPRRCRPRARRRQRQRSRAAPALAQPRAAAGSADLPAFGGGIEFRPRAARTQPGGGGGGGGGGGDAGGPRPDRLGGGGDGGSGGRAMALEAEGPAAGEAEEARPAPTRPVSGLMCSCPGLAA